MEPKRTNLGVSIGPSKSERATISAGNKKVEVNYAPDHQKDAADVAAEKTIAQKQHVEARYRKVEKENLLPGGRSSKAIDTNTKKPVFSDAGSDSDNPHVKSLAKHASDFITHQMGGKSAKAEASRTAFHALHSTVAAKKQKGANYTGERPCSTAGCKNTNIGKSSCEGGQCSTVGSVNVQRPKG